MKNKMAVNMVEQEGTREERIEGKLREEMLYDESGEAEKCFTFFRLPPTYPSKPSNLTCTSKFLSD